jgi:hypothetical protein
MKNLIHVAAAMVVLACIQSVDAAPPKLIDLEKITEAQLKEARAVDVFASAAHANANASERKTIMAETELRFSAEVRYHLAALYYPVDLSAEDLTVDEPSTAEQIKRFEATLRGPGVKVDGVLTFFEFSELVRIDKLSRAIPLWISQNDVQTSKFEVRDYASVNASGTWVMQNDQIAWPLNWSSVDCNREEGTCEMTEINVAGPSGRELSTSNVDYYQLLPPITGTTFRVTRWAENIVEARSVPPLGGNECRFTTLTINLSAKTVTQITQDSEKQCEIFGGQKLDRLTQPRITVMQSPTEVFSKHYEELLVEVERHYGSVSALVYDRPYLPKKY